MKVSPLRHLIDAYDIMGAEQQGLVLEGDIPPEVLAVLEPYIVKPDLDADGPPMSLDEFKDIVNAMWPEYQFDFSDSHYKLVADVAFESEEDPIHFTVSRWDSGRWTICIGGEPGRSSHESLKEAVKGYINETIDDGKLLLEQATWALEFLDPSLEVSVVVTKKEGA